MDSSSKWRSVVVAGWWSVHVGDITTAGDGVGDAPEEANQSPANSGGRMVDPLELSQGDKRL